MYLSVSSMVVVALPENHTVDTAEGSGAPGCDETNECFLPYSLDIRVGDTVTWNNIDTAAHTVTSGSISDGADGLFDSSLFMSGTSFEVTFDETGTFDYFCMVHPWMTGMVKLLKTWKQSRTWKCRGHGSRGHGTSRTWKSLRHGS